MHECPTCGQACDCDGGGDLEGSAPDDCACPCALDACADCPHLDLCEPGNCLADPDDDDDCDDSGCPACGGHGAHFATCPDLRDADRDTDCDT
jgi:hypothetical protein